MKILQLPSWYMPEGGMFCTEQSIALQQLGVEVHILANVVLPWRKYNWRLFTYPFKPFFATEHSIELLRYYGWRIPFADLPNMHVWVTNTLRLFALYTKKYGKPDIIHAHSGMWAGFAASIIKKRYGIPYVITEHRGRFSENSQDTEKLLPKTYTRYLVQAFSQADSIVTVSNQLANRIRTYAGERVPITTISNVVDTDFFTPNDAATKSNIFTFMNANSYHYAKGYDILLAAFEKVHTTYPSTQLLLLGTGFEDNQFQIQLNRLSAKNNILFKGYQSAEGVRRYLRKSDCFVLSSRIEAQPVAVLEAMSCGLPIVCTEVVPNEIATETVAVRCQTNHVEELAKAMIYVIENKQRFNAQKIRAQAVAVCSRKAVGKQLISIYNGILHG
jgi:L-malate glycosyltransferase